jgi:hypothetical protein
MFSSETDLARPDQSALSGRSHWPKGGSACALKRKSRDPTQAGFSICKSKAQL